MCHESAQQGADCSHDGRIGLLKELQESWDIARIGNENIVHTNREQAQAIHGERKHMIERKRRDDVFLTLDEPWLHPLGHLKQIVQDVFLRKHRGFRNTGGAAGVLQKREVFKTD